MGHINRSTVIACPPAHVYDVLLDVDRLDEVSHISERITGPGRPLQQGDTFEQVVKVMGKELETTWELVEAQPGSLLRFEGTAAAGARATLIERLSEDPGGTRVDLDVEYDLPLGILGDAIDAIFMHSKQEENAELILEKLKAVCEAQS